jgi:HEPN domain-containing protein
MNKSTFEQLSRMRTHEARILLEAGEHAGAYYLMGYAVECALKACICRQVREFDFPDKDLVIKAYTHDLEKLVNVAGLEADFNSDRETNPDFAINWTVVKEWNESARYALTISEEQAGRFYLACTGENGVLPWIEERW